MKGTPVTAEVRLGRWEDKQSRHAIGAEMDRDAFEIARRTLAGDEARPTIEQPSLFDAMEAP